VDHAAAGAARRRKFGVTMVPDGWRPAEVDPNRHQARTGSGPHALAVCRNLLISLLRLSGHTNIARALRHHARHPDQAIALVASEQPTTQ